VLDTQTEKAVVRVVEQVRLLFGSDLVSIALYGSAAGDDFVPGRSDLNVAIVVQRLTFAHLKALHRHLRRWHALGVATPLLLDRRFLERARDVFPMEFHDIKAQHRVLYGEEVFATLPIDGRHLRYQAEHEARGKLLRLRALYAEVGARRNRLEGLMLSSVKTFLLIMRNFTRLRTGEGATRYLQALDQFEEHFAVTFPTMRHLIRVKLGLDRWADGIDATFSAYLEEVERVVDLIDRIVPESVTATASGTQDSGVRG
jgi:predicted nucleotidyltransferase